MSERTKNLKRYWQSHKADRAKALEAVIKQAQKSRMSFKFKTDLAKYAAAEMTRSLATDEPISSSSLLRDKEVYGPILDSFFKEEKSKSALASEKLELQLQIRELSIENGQLNEQLQMVLSQRSELEHKAKINRVHGGLKKAQEHEFKIWKKVLEKLLSEIEGSYIDIPNRLVRDPAMGKVLLNCEDFPNGFFEFLEKQQ